MKKSNSNKVSNINKETKNVPNKEHNSSPFKGKYTYYENINWKERRVEKEFDSKEDYDAFVQEEWINFNMFDKFSSFFDNFSLNFPKISHYNPLPDVLDSFNRKRLIGKTESLKEEGIDIDMNKYHEEASRIKQEEYSKKRKLQELENTLKDLEHYSNIFKQKEQKELLKDVEEDIKKIKKKMEEIK